MSNVYFLANWSRQAWPALCGHYEVGGEDAVPPASLLHAVSSPGVEGGRYSVSGRQQLKFPIDVCKEDRRGLTLIVQVPVDLQSSPTASPKPATLVPPWRDWAQCPDLVCLIRLTAEIVTSPAFPPFLNLQVGREDWVRGGRRYSRVTWHGHKCCSSHSWVPSWCRLQGWCRCWSPACCRRRRRNRPGSSHSYSMSDGKTNCPRKALEASNIYKNLGNWKSSRQSSFWLIWQTSSFLCLSILILDIK